MALIAGAIYGTWGAIITLMGILTSWINDSLGNYTFVQFRENIIV